MADGAGPSPRLGVRVQGAVQGVGFRPFVARLAQAHRLAGHVCNDGAGVWIEVEGPGAARFVAALQESPPPLARIESIAVRPLPATGEKAFLVAPSQAGAARSARIPADAGICAACVGELFDPADRRFLYPFIACCDCGPRYTMTRALPYDRPQTAMAAFPLCAACAGEYADLGSRRFHAEPACCAACGPAYPQSPPEMFARIAAGEILAVRGVGGYHLLADARQPDVVARLRARKERSAKPFAVMAANVASVALFAAVGPAEAALLQSPARPIVLLQAKARGTPEGVSPDLDTIGVMLPATGLHWLLFHEAAGRPAGLGWTKAAQAALFIATSANPGGEPLVTDPATARARLSGIADAIIDHDREIIVRADDPVCRVIEGAPRVLRRGRGQTPEPIKLPRAIAPTLAFGGHLKAAVCVTRGDEAFLAQHVGDLDDPETLAFHAETAARLVALLGVTPVLAACDLHPDFASTRAAFASGLPVVQVQHHHAHAAGCLAENGVRGPALALALDGYGYGDAGEAWGGELLVVDGAHCRRLGGLAPLPAPGGDRAAREPWRMAAGVLHSLGRGEEIAARFAGQPRAGAVAALLGKGVAHTSAAGRYFDAAAGLLGICPVQGFEAEAAMRLEALARPGPAQGLWALEESATGLRLCFAPAFEQLAVAGPEEGASLFHAEFASGLAALAARAAAQEGLRQVALTGGCCANHRLIAALCTELRAAGLEPLLHRHAPPGDGGLALGQAVVAGLKHEGG